MLSVVVGLVTVLAAALGVLLITGQTAVVVTRGVSMNPVYFQGDLVVVAKEAEYRQGQIVAYRIGTDNEVILHRIVGGDRNGFTIKGDNNQSTDPARPEADQIIGAALLHIPQAGTWLRSFTSPPMLGLITFALLASGSTAAAARHTHRKRRKMSMSRHLTGSEGPLRSVRALSRAQYAAAVLTVLLGLLGIVVAVPAWAGPLEEPAGGPSTPPAQMRFSYSASVPVSPAYDETTVSSPDTVFRKLTDTVNIHLVYAGTPGTVAVTAELSTAGGWHSTVLLAAGTRFADHRYEAILPLDLKAIDARAQAAAAVTGIPAGPVSVVVLASVTTDAGEDFKPALRFSLTPLQLTLNGSEKDLTVTGPAPGIESVPRTMGVGEWRISAAEARTIAVIILVAAVLSGALLWASARRKVSSDEGLRIRRRYADLLVKVRPMPAPSGRPVIDVTSFATLAKLAKRYGLLVLHWARSDVETFIVQDEGTTYRYRTGKAGAETELSTERVPSDA